MTHTSAAALPADSRYSSSNAPQLFVRDSDGNYLTAPDDRVIDAARQLVERSVSKGMKLNTPNRVREFLWLKLAGYDHEVFGAIFLDTQSGTQQAELLVRLLIDNLYLSIDI